MLTSHNSIGVIFLYSFYWFNSIGYRPAEHLKTPVQLASPAVKPDNGPFTFRHKTTMNLDAWRHYLRARLFEKLKRPQQAAEEFRAALGFDPGFLRAVNGLAFLLATQKEDGEAERWFREGLRLQPGNGMLHFNLGFVLDRQGRREDAVAAFREAVRLNPKLDRAWYGLGMACAHLGRHEEAAQALQEAATLQPMNAHAWYALGMAYHHSHNPDKVKEVVDHLFRFDPVMTRRLIQDAERSDLAHLVQDLRV